MEDIIEIDNPTYLYSVLTVTTKGYEPVREVINPNPNVEYVCVTDDPELTSKTWKIIYKENIWFLYVKHHQFEFVSTDVCLWLDGSYQITSDPTNEFILPFINSSKEFAISLHDIRHNVIEECIYWMFTRGLAPENGETFIREYINNQTISDTLLQTSCMLTKKTESVINIFRMVCDLEEKCSVNGPYRDDQTILSYIVYKYAYNWAGFLLMNFENTINNKFFHMCGHGTDQPLQVRQYSYRCFDTEQKNLYRIGNPIY